jgi:hypothetical protein
VDQAAPEAAHHARVGADEAAIVDVGEALGVARRGQAEAGDLIFDEEPAPRVVVLDGEGGPPRGRQRPERVTEAQDGARPLELGGLAGEDGPHRRGQLQVRAGDVRVDVGRADLEGAEVHAERHRGLLAPAEDVVLGEREAEQREDPVLHLEVRVQAQAPDVARDHQEVDAPLPARPDRQEHDGVGEEGIDQVAARLVDQLLVPDLPGPQQDLAPDHVRARGGVEDVEEGEEPLARREHLEVDHVHLPDGLAVGSRVELEPHVPEGVVHRLALQLAELLVLRERARPRRQEDQDGGGERDSHRAVPRYHADPPPWYGPRIRGKNEA